MQPPTAHRLSSIPVSPTHAPRVNDSRNATPPLSRSLSPIAAMSPPLDVADGVFRDLPSVRDLTAAASPGPVSTIDGDDGVGNFAVVPPYVWKPTTQVRVF